jgi:hypothetical protein
MKTPKPQDLEKAAIRAARGRSELKDPVLRGVEEDTVPSSGERIYRCHVGSEPSSNEPATSVVLDAKGKEVDLEALEEQEQRRLFTEVRYAASSMAAVAASIDPVENIFTLNPGDTHTEVVTVRVPKSGAAPRADVYFLADTTGSMGSILAAVQSGAGSILAALAGLGVDFHFGVGNYKDFPRDPYAFQHQQSLTNLAGAVTAAINGWSASGGGDIPEGQFFALHKLAEPPGGAIGWRAGAKRIVVWFGDAPGHDPICAAISGEPASITEASATARLTVEAITVLAISVLAPGLDADPTAGATDYGAQCGPPGGSAGQATRIANATSGQFVSGIDAGNIVNTIISLVTSAVSDINNLRLVASGGTAPFVASINPAAGYGPLSGEEEHEVNFEVVFRGQPCREEEQVFTGSLDALADGSVIASKRVRITVPPCATAGFVYSVKFVCGQQPECGCECTPVRPGIYATEINLHNYHDWEVTVEKRVIPVVFMGAPVGREPRVGTPRATDRIVLPAHSATMDDCCRIEELLLGGRSASPRPLTIGFLEITSSHELAVSAVYTVSDPTSGRVSIDVEQIESVRARPA